MPQTAPASWPDPGLTRLSLVGHIGSQSIQLGDGLTVLPTAAQSLAVGAELTLDVNAPPSTDYDDGWSVYIVRSAVGEQMPGLRDWVFFADLTTGPTDVSGGIAATVLGNVIHVFWISPGTPYGLLGHLTIDSNGAVSAPTTVDAQAVDFCEVSAVVHKGAVNVFYCAHRKASFPEQGTLGVLRRAVLNPAGAFDLSDIDGDGVGSQGAIKGVVGLVSSGVSAGNDLHVIYVATRDRNVPGDPGDGLGAVVEDLRHARVTTTGPEVAGAPYIWFAETIDGMGGSAGKVSGDTGLSIAAMLDVAAQVHVFYSLGRITGRATGGSDLRHAEFNWVGGATQRWKLETLDGAGRTFANASGQMRGMVGLGTASVLRSGELNVFYNDVSNANLRWGVKPQGVPWAFQTVDGQADSLAGRGPRRYGRTADGISVGRKTAVSLGNQVSVFYEDRDADVLRHAYKRPGLPWMMEVVDGDTTLGGRVRSAVGIPAAVVRGGLLNLIYFDSGRLRLRHAVLSR